MDLRLDSNTPREHQKWGGAFCFCSRPKKVEHEISQQEAFTIRSHAALGTNRLHSGRGEGIQIVTSIHVLMLYQVHIRIRCVSSGSRYFLVRFFARGSSPIRDTHKREQPDPSIVGTLINISRYTTVFLSSSSPVFPPEEWEDAVHEPCGLVW